MTHLAGQRGGAWAFRTLVAEYPAYRYCGYSCRPLILENHIIMVFKKAFEQLLAHQREGVRGASNTSWKLLLSRLLTVTVKAGYRTTKAGCKEGLTHLAGRKDDVRAHRT